MTAQGIVMQPGKGTVQSFTPGRAIVTKLRCADTADSMMVFEETVPTGTKSTFHLHHDSDEIAYVLEGEVTFLIGDEVTVGGPGSCAFMPRDVPHAWKSTGAEPGKVLFLYTPGRAGKFFEELLHRPAGPVSDRDFAQVGERHGWEVVGPPPF